MKPIRRHFAALIVAALAVATMFMAPAVSFAAPAIDAAIASSSDCSEMDQEKGPAICSADCAILCHALIVPSIEIGDHVVLGRISYSVGHRVLGSAVVEDDDPPPR